MRELKALEDEEMDPVDKRGESGARVTHWNWGRCGRMCRGEGTLDATS